MSNSKINSEDWSTRTKRTTARVAIWTGAWVLTVALASFGPEFFWGSNKMINILVILLNLAVGTGMVIANIKHLKILDEMMQKVQLEAMGISLGVALVGGIGYSMMDVTNVIPFDAEIAFLIMLIGITYLISIFVNIRRYK